MEPGMPFKVLVLDTLELCYVRRRRARSGGLIETARTIGFRVEDHLEYDTNSTRLYRSIHWSGSNWRRMEVVLAGLGEWTIVPPKHPDCLVVREPCEGQIFESDTELLWLGPGRLVELGGPLAARVLDGRHGEIVECVEEHLRNVVFDECLAVLTAEYGYELEGRGGRFLIEELTRRVWSENLLGADEGIVGQIADAVDQAAQRNAATNEST